MKSTNGGRLSAISYLLGLLLMAGVARAQLAPGGTAAAPQVSLAGVESPIVSTSYVLMPGDGILVTVIGGLAYSYPTVVTYEGKLPVSAGGTFSSILHLELISLGFEGSSWRM